MRNGIHHTAVQQINAAYPAGEFLPLPRSSLAVLTLLLEQTVRPWGVAMAPVGRARRPPGPLWTAPARPRGPGE